MELNLVNFEISEKGMNLDKNLKGLKWISPDYENPKEEIQLLNEAKKEIISESNIKIIITDYLIFSFITNNKTLTPNKWFDDLSVPDKNNIFFKSYKSFFQSKLIEQNIKIVYILGADKLDYFTRIFSNLDCLKQKEINKILIKIYINDCYS